MSFGLFFKSGLMDLLANTITWKASGGSNIFAAIYNSALYTPSLANQFLSAASGISGAEPAANTGYTRMPIPTAAMVSASLTNPQGDFVLLPSTAANVTWLVTSGKTMTGGWVVFYSDLDHNAAYYPSGSGNNGPNDGTYPVLGYAPFIDAVTGLNYWTASGTTPVVLSFDATFAGYKTVFQLQID